MGVFLAAQNAMNQLWGVPYKRRPDFLRPRLRALLAARPARRRRARDDGARRPRHLRRGYGIGWKIGSIALSTALNVGLFWVGFRLLTAQDVTWRQLRGGAIAAAIVYEMLQTLGGYYVGHVVKSASNTYGTFALVIGLLSWIYLAAHITLLAAEANVVATRRLWPRSFSLVIEQPPTEADRGPHPAHEGRTTPPRTRRSRSSSARERERVSSAAAGDADLVPQLRGPQARQAASP